MKASIRVIVITLCIAGLSGTAQADFCTEFLNSFDDQGRTIVPIAIDQATILNEAHIPILVETSGALPAQSAFYDGPTNSRKEISVIRHLFDGSNFSTHQSARVSKVLRTDSPAEGQRHLGVWSFGLEPGSSSYFFYLRVVRKNFVDFSVVAKNCYADFATALVSRPELQELFNDGTAYSSTEIANINEEAFAEVAEVSNSLQSLVSITSDLQSSLSSLQNGLAKAKSLKVQYRKLGRLLRRLRFIHNQYDGPRAKRKVRDTSKRGHKLDSSNSDAADQVNQTLANL